MAFRLLCITVAGLLTQLHTSDGVPPSAPSLTASKPTPLNSYSILDNTLNAVLGLVPSFNWSVNPNDLASAGDTTKLKIVFQWLGRMRVCDGSGSWYTGVSECGTQACCNTWSPHTWLTDKPPSKSNLRDNIMRPKVFTCAGEPDLPEAWYYSGAGMGSVMSLPFKAWVPLCNSQKVGSNGDTWQFSFLSEMVAGIVGCYSAGYTGLGGYFPTTGSGTHVCYDVSATGAAGAKYADAFIWGSRVVKVRSDCPSLRSWDAAGLCVGLSGSGAGVGGFKYLYVNTAMTQRPDSTLLDMELAWNPERFMYCNPLAQICFARFWLRGIQYAPANWNVSYGSVSFSTSVNYVNPVATSVAAIVTSVVTTASELQTQLSEMLLFQRIEVMATVLYALGRTNYDSLYGDPLILCDAAYTGGASVVFSTGPLRISMNGSAVPGKVICNVTHESAELTTDWGDLATLNWIGPMAANYTLNGTDFLALLSKLNISINPLAALARSLMRFAALLVGVVCTGCIMMVHVKFYAVPNMPIIVSIIFCIWQFSIYFLEPSTTADFLGAFS